MEKIYIVLLAVLTSFSLPACSGWLDVSPEDIVEEKDLFKEGEGYRNALNGVYRLMSSSSLFGRELTWGVADFMSQSYPSYNYGDNVYVDFVNRKYTTKKAKQVIQGIWETAYNAIGNTNNIINKIESEPASKFKGGKMEQDMILGEALAVRAFLHFQMLCYFAPSLAKEHAGNWIPYYEKFSFESAEYVSVEKCLEFCIRDLKRAVELVEPFDTYEKSLEDNHLRWLIHDIRFLSPGTGSTNAYWPDDIFYAYRGYRFNIMAVRAALARVYSYAGEYESAAAEAQRVIDFKADGSNKALSMTTTTQVAQNYKMSYDLIFALSDLKLQFNYTSYMTLGQMKNTTLDYGYDTKAFDSQSDYRLKTLLEKKGSYYYTRRYKTPTAGGSAQILDMLPVIRLSEMYYIQAEYQASMGKFPEAIVLLDVVRSGRDCPIGLLNSKIPDQNSFVTELLKETRREFLEEGLIFYYYKKYGRSTLSYGTMKDSDFYFPLPDTETVN